MQNYGICFNHLTIKDLIDAKDEHKNKQEWMKAKLADLEDRSRRNDIRIRRISETVQQSDLSRRITELLTALLPDAAEFIIQYLLKPSHLPDHVLREVILHIYFQHI